MADFNNGNGIHERFTPKGIDYWEPYLWDMRLDKVGQRQRRAIFRPITGIVDRFLYTEDKAEEFAAAEKKASRRRWRIGIALTVAALLVSIGGPILANELVTRNPPGPQVIYVPVTPAPTGGH